MTFLKPEEIMAVAPETAAQLEQAAFLAERLNIPLVDTIQNEYHHLLVVTLNRLELRQIGPKAPGPIFVDFLSDAADYRRKYGGGRKQAIARAVGIKGKYLPTIMDATAGLGKDAFVIACLGCKVTLFERSPIIYALLDDGIKRAQAANEIGVILRERMNISFGDSKDLLQKMAQEKPDVIYLDPMYPHRTKSALVKKEMRVLRAIVGDDQDAPELLKMALQYAHRRVVVKRPKLALPIEGPEPNLITASKNSRFDVYLIS